MLELKVSVARPTHHSQQPVKCNGSQYSLPIPLQTYRFVEITQEIVFKADQEGLIAVLSGKRDTVASFDQFYKLQDDGLKYFNLRAELNFDDLTLKVLSETDKILIELDRCRFPDLLALLRKAYDTYAKKLHSKFNRRIKKYLTLSTRSEAQKQQIKRLLDLIKAQSTDEEANISVEKPEAKKESPVKMVKEPSVKVVKNVELEEPKKEPARKVKAKQAETKIKKGEENKQTQKDESPEQKPVKKDQKHSHFYQQLKKDKNAKKNKAEQHHKHEDNEQDWEDIQSDDEGLEEEKSKPTKEKKKPQVHKKKEEPKEEDQWEDIHDQKIHKRMQKNLRRKHEKFDVQGKKQNQSTDRDYGSSSFEPTPYREREPKRNNNGNGNGNRSLFQKSKEKPKKDLRVLLGINGDTDDGWRERYRVERVPVQQMQPQKNQKNNKKKWVAREESQPVPKGETSEKETSRPPFQKQPKPDNKKQQKIDQVPPKKEEPAIQSQKVVILPSTGSLQKVFSFPADGKSFVLDPTKDYRVRVNNNFWIMLQKGHVKIEREKAGYIRDGKFSSSEENLIEAQDITISLSGMCNLEDGGVPFGNPNIQDFTGTDSQWFHLKELQVYAYK